MTALELTSKQLSYKDTPLHMTCHRDHPSCDDMTTSIKPEVHNVSQHHQRRTEPRPQATCIENLEKFGRVVYKISSNR